MPPLHMLIRVCCLTLLVSACAATSQVDEVPRTSGTRSRPLVQGMVGAGQVDVHSITLADDGDTVEPTGDATLPTLGGAVMYPLGGRKVRFGVEGGFTFGWEGDFEAFVTSSGGTVVASENDLFLMDAFVGAYADMAFGERARGYISGGGLMQYASVDIEYDDSTNNLVSEDGFGTGLYARLGFEILIDGGTYVGLCVRVMNSTIDIGQTIDDIELDQTQWLLTVSKGF